MKTQYPALNEMLADMENERDLYKPTKYWDISTRQVLERLSEYGLPEFRKHKELCRFFVANYGIPQFLQDSDYTSDALEMWDNFEGVHPKYRTSFLQLLMGEDHALSDYRVYRASDRAVSPYIDQVTESDVGQPHQQFEFDGRMYGRSFLNYLLGICFLKNSCDTSKISRVLEIGGGFGSLGEVLLSDRRNDITYIDIDLPVTSFIATYYLQQVFGEKEIADYSCFRGDSVLHIEAMAGMYRGVILCPWQIERLQGTIDLFVNFISFQEMEPDVVENYLVHVDRFRPRYVLLRNLREGKNKATLERQLGVTEPILAADYDRFLPGYECTSINTIPFGYRTPDGFHSELRLYERIS